MLREDEIGFRAGRLPETGVLMFCEFFEKLRSDVFVKHPDEIEKRNLEGLGQFTVIGFFAAAVNLLMFLLFRHFSSLFLALVMLVYYTAMLGVFYHVSRMKGRHSTLIFYLALTPALLFTALSGTVFDPTHLTFSFMLLIVAAPVFILDRPWRLITYTLAMGAVYLVLAVIYKDPSIVQSDLIHLSSSMTIAVGLDLFILEIRIIGTEKEVVLRQISEHDTLTGAFNRGGGEGRIRRYLEDGVSGTFFLMDLDDFKQINDTYGHSQGDVVLEQAAVALRETFCSTDVVMRMGGDEFIVYAPGMLAQGTVDAKIAEIRNRMADLKTGGISVSIGCVVNETADTGYDELFRQADRLLYQAKSNGKNNCTSERLHVNPANIS